MKQYFPVYIKFTNAAETHNGFKFKTGLNTDINEFNPNPYEDCGPYCLYFTDAENCIMWRTVCRTYAREVTLPDGEHVVPLDIKYRAHRIILGPRHDLSKDKAWKWLVSKGVDVTACNNEALVVASRHGHLDVVKYLVSRGADDSLAYRQHLEVTI